MKLQFDPNQPFQRDAVAAVTDLFDGSPRGTPEFSIINLGEGSGMFSGQVQTELGVDNRLLSVDEKLTENLRAIQLRNDIEIDNPGAAMAAILR
ncbi:MAG: hypothetical protein HYX63_22845 [Gammaproteobacteria bacterium]|nr:hypothetical protein [Gammaproteobacteria bacterium]